MSHAFVTGANGHIGSNIVRELLARGHEVTAFVRPSADLRSLDGLSVTIARGDVLDPVGVERAMARAELVFHAAANFSLWARTEDEVLRPSIDGTRNVLRAAKRVAARRVVYTSSAAAVGASETADRLLSSDDWSVDPRVPYYRAKVRGEELARELASETGVDLVTVCPTLVLGPHDYRMTPSQRPIVDLVSGRGVTVDGGMNIVGVRDVAEGHVLAATEGRSFGRYILGGDNMTISELGAIIAVLTGVKPRHVRLPKWAFKGLAALMEIGAGIRNAAPALTRAAVEDVLGKYAWYDTGASRHELGLEPAPAMMVVAEALQWYAERGWLPPDVAHRLSDGEVAESIAA
jgi:dihydroflavonol-4-reductase